MGSFCVSQCLPWLEWALLIVNGLFLPSYFVVQDSVRVFIESILSSGLSRILPFSHFSSPPAERVRLRLVPSSSFLSFLFLFYCRKRRPTLRNCRRRWTPTSCARRCRRRAASSASRTSRNSIAPSKTTTGPSLPSFTQFYPRLGWVFSGWKSVASHQSVISLQRWVTFTASSC